MRFAIADPPYPPHTSLRIDARRPNEVRVYTRSRATRWYSGHADFHPEASEWDDHARHRLLMLQLDEEYDGWAIATSMDGPNAYGRLPDGARWMVWQITNATPSRARVASTCELVAVKTPAGRLAMPATGPVPDLLRAGAPRKGFAGSKPPVWTEWVLAAMGCAPGDQLTDVFPGSGGVGAAATAALSQGALL